MVGLEVWSDSDKCPVTQDPFTTLHEFLDWRKVKLLPQKPHDNAQLIRYPFPTVFSTCSKKDLAASLEKGVGMCLYNMPEVKVLYGGQKCGNGYVEEGEECDCGEPEECMNPCCNATTCTLKGEAVCAHGQCCEDCRLKPAGTPCRESSNSCDLPEFCTGASPHCPANVYLHDGHACHNVEGYCYNGICQTHEQQCITLWGSGAKPAPGICFERVNSAGDPYGNCGKDSKGSFAKCEARDAKCGKIQCQGGANRPVIGTNAVSIETNIPLQEGGRILCRGTHVYLGDDMPDPGLVLAGTKCGEGMVRAQYITGLERDTIGCNCPTPSFSSPEKKKISLLKKLSSTLIRSLSRRHVAHYTGNAKQMGTAFPSVSTDLLNKGRSRLFHNLMLFLFALKGREKVVTVSCLYYRGTQVQGSSNALLEMPFC
uniref:ADAM metallopeptidase domain 12 n=1 Tax=Myripristis murdjan TaxID=586833 RepID=A0A667XYK0_9TELE